MDPETERFLQEPGCQGKSSLKMVVMGYQGAGKKTLVDGIQRNWSELRSRSSRKGERTDDLGIRGRDVNIEVIETAVKRPFPFIQRLPSCDAYLLVYSMVCEDSFKSVTAVRDQIIQQKGDSIPIIFVANKTDIAQNVDKTRRVYRDLFISCEWEHGHYEISARNSTDINRVLQNTMRRVNKTTP
ncbi:GTP-binding protein Rheb homolog 1-like [Haliotis rubra]|uniref:GTP-binding protein Rheb homolog 1-like n=1 Tax=Haliotis rubra TaxID=36100 RepID=UPI001EE5AF35|nr:GTP-binding protein Rheb homolog 1-like [Haliotis rubra]